MKNLLPAVRSWVEEMARFTGADSARIRVVEEADDDRLLAEAVQAGELLPLADGNYYTRSHPEDVARSEERTFIATPHSEDQGLYNNWRPEAEIRPQVEKRVKGSYAGQRMYVIPYLMGPPGSEFAQVGVQITNSRTVVLNMIRMTKVGGAAMEALWSSEDFVKGVHATGDLNQVRRGGEEEDDRYFVNFPASREIWSFGSAYGGNALLSKKFHSLRQAGYDAWKDAKRGRHWLAEHMMIMGIEDRQRAQVRYLTGAFPSASGKTNLAMMMPPQVLNSRYRIWLVGDDIAWLFVGKDGRLRAINPENGFFGVAPGTNERTNPNAMAAIRPGTKTLFTNVAFNPRTRQVWWEDKTEQPPSDEDWLDWKGQPWSPGSGRLAAHPNSRFTAFAKNAPNLSSHWRDPEGVPVNAILFGGRLLKGEPLIRQTPDAAGGVYDGAVMGVETTAAASGTVGVFRPDPMAMRPFFSYPEADYFQHWLDVMERLGENAPGIFHVNWFRKGEDGRFLWPGFGENLRVLLWALDRLEGKAKGARTPIGFIPAKEDLFLEGSNIPETHLDRLLTYEPDYWSKEIERRTEWLSSMDSRLPSGLLKAHQQVVQAVASEHPAIPSTPSFVPPLP